MIMYMDSRSGTSRPCAEEKTIFYHKCKVEQYAPYTQDDGLVQRITLYKESTDSWRFLGAG